MRLHEHVFRLMALISIFLFLFSAVVNTLDSLANTDISREMAVKKQHPNHQPHEISTKIPWKKLDYEARAALIKIEVDITLQEAQGICPIVVRAEPGFMNCPLPSKEALLITVKTQMSPPLLSAERYEHRVWFDSRSLTAFQRSRWKLGESGWLKLYRWKENGVERIKLLPENTPAGSSAPVKWKRKSSSFFHYPEEELSCSAISEPVLLLYLASILSLQQMEMATGSPFLQEGRQHGKGLSLCVFGKKQLHEVKLMELEESEELVDYLLIQGTISPQQSIKRAARIPIKAYKLRTKALPPDDAEPEPFSLLGLETEIEFHLDPTYHVPVRLIGQNRLLGKIELALKEAVLK